MASVPPASSVVSASASPGGGGGGGFGHHLHHQHHGHTVHYAAADVHQLQHQQHLQHQHQQHLHGHATAAALASLTEVGAGGVGPGTPSSAGAGLPGGGDVEGGVEGDGEGGGDGEGDSDGVAEVEGLRAVAASAKVSRKLRQASKQRGWGWREARAEYLRLEEQRRKALGRPGGAAGASFWCYLTPVLVVDGNASTGPNGSSSPSAVLGLGLRCVCGEVHLNVSNPAKVCHDHLATAACKAITPEQRARLVNKKNKPGPPLASASAAAEQNISPIHHIHNNAATSNHRPSAINDSPTAQDQSRPDVLPWDARERGGGKRARAVLVDSYEQQQGSAKRSQAYVPIQSAIDNKDDELEEEAAGSVGLRAKFAGLKSCMADLEEALLEQRQQQHPQLAATSDERTQQHIASLQARIASLEGESAQRAAEASDALKEFAQRDAEVQRLTAVSAQLQARIERMEAARASTDDADQLASTSLVKQLASRESELQRLAAVNSDLQASIQAVEAERMRDVEERMSAKAVDMMAGLKSQLFRQQQRLEEGEGEVRTLRNAIEELRVELQLRDQAMATLQRSLLEKESTNACLQEEVNQLRGEAADRGSRLHELEAECESLRFRLAGQTVAVDDARLLETPQTRLTELEEPSAFGEGENVQVDLQ
eukprot:jgi/Chlat1/9017/Chrsp94S08350